MRPCQNGRMDTVCTIGHSNRTIEDFIGLLWQNGIACLLDIRTVPKSRHNPQFNEDDLKKSLRKAHIRYRHIKNSEGYAKQQKIL